MARPKPVEFVTDPDYVPGPYEPKPLHVVGDVPGGDVSWPVPGTPDVFPPATHTHTIEQVDGLGTALDGKQASGSYATQSALTQGLAGKQDTGDYATQSDLTSGLAGKQDAGDYQPAGDYVTSAQLSALEARVATLENAQGD